MRKRILVAYASGSGSTAEVAEAIAQALGNNEVEVNVEPVTAVTDLSSFSALVLGSSIRAGRWLPGAIHFIDKFRSQMNHMPVAYFTTCLTMINETSESKRIVLSYMEPVRQLAPEIEPVGIGLFAGSLAPELERILPGESGPFGDYRNWDAIEAWAKEIRPMLLTRKDRKTAPLVLSQTILSYTDISGLNLSHTNLVQAELHETKLRQSDLHGADLRRSELIGADLQQADLRQAGLGWADLSHSNLYRADLTEANLMGAILNDANLSNANLTLSILNGATLCNANLKQAILVRADLNWANMQRADLTGADCRSANLNWADLSEVTLTHTKLKDATYNRQTIWPKDFSADKAGCILVDQPH